MAFSRKSDFHLSKKLILFTESPLKMMKNAFYLPLKTFSFSRYLNFCLDFFYHERKRLDKKAVFKIYHAMNWEANSYNADIYCPISQEVKTI